jgi:cytochrome c oxidase subunit 2
MPIAVIVKSEADYAKWVAESKTKWGTKAAASSVVAAPAEDDSKVFTMAEAKEKGEKIYAANCVACHQAGGKGMPPAFPPLAGSKIVLGPSEQQIGVVLNGRPGTAMQPFARLSNSELAAVITYTKNSFGNSVGKVVQPADIKAARK